MNALGAGWWVARERLLAPRVGVAYLLAAISALAVGWLERDHPSANHALRVTSGLVVPVWSYWLLVRAAGTAELSTQLEPLARAGIDRRRSSLALLVIAEVLAACSSALLIGLSLWSTPAGPVPMGMAQLGSALWVGALGGASYAALIGFGMTFGRSGYGKVIALMLDWVLGTGTSALASPWPRAYLRQLLGGEPVIGLAAWGGSVALLLLVALYTAWAAMRTSR